MISSPIILYDYPKIAPESPGDLFDAAEIDEILTLRIMSMTDEEKHEMRHVDEQARRILERTEALPEEHLLKMHGALRDLRPLDEDFFNPKSRIESVNVAGVPLHAGSRVRIRPKGRADVMDLALAGKTAVDGGHRMRCRGPDPAGAGPRGRSRQRSRNDAPTRAPLFLRSR